MKAGGKKRVVKKRVVTMVPGAEASGVLRDLGACIVVCCAPIYSH